MPVYLGQALDIPADYQAYTIGGLNAEIVNFMRSYISKQWEWNQSIELGKIVLPMYQQLVADGTYDPFEFHEAKRTGIKPTQTGKLTRYIADETGIEYLFIWQYLTALESMAKGGVTDFKHYDPALKDLKTLTEPNLLQDVANTLPTIFRSIPQTIDTVSKRAVLIGGIGLGVYVLFTANKFIRKKK